MIVKATMLLACIVYCGGQGTQWMERRALKYNKLFTVELSGGQLKLAVSGEPEVSVAVNINDSRLIKSFEIKRKNQFIKHLHLKCRNYGTWNIKFLCGKSSNVYDIKELVSGAKMIRDYDWAVGSTKKCNDDDDSEYCVRCSACYQDGDNQINTCPDYKQTMNCKSDYRCESSMSHGTLAKYKCKSFPVLMNPGCKYDGCVGLNWKTSDIQMLETCKMPDDVDFKITMKLWEQGTPSSPAKTPTHEQTITFRDGKDDIMFVMKIKYFGCQPKHCKIRVGAMSTAPPRKKITDALRM